MHGRASKAAEASEVRNDLRAALTTIEASKNITAAAQEARRKAEARGRDPRGNPLSALAEGAALYRLRQTRPDDEIAPKADGLASLR
jgi:hypothetical protein